MVSWRRNVRWLVFVGCLLLVVIIVGAVHMRNVSKTRKIAETLTGGDPDRAIALIRRYGCGGCHTIAGMAGADGQVGPPLVDMRRRVFIGGALRNTPQALIGFIVEPQSKVPGSAMPVTGITEAEARDVVAFLYAQ